MSQLDTLNILSTKVERWNRYIFMLSWRDSIDFHKGTFPVFQPQMVHRARPSADN